MENESNTFSLNGKVSNNNSRLFDFSDDDDFDLISTPVWNRSTKQNASSKSKKSNCVQTESKPKQMQQLCLDFGQKNPGRKKCPDCQMEYVVGKEDKEHKVYHKMKLSEADLCAPPLSLRLKEPHASELCVSRDKDLQIYRITQSLFNEKSSQAKTIGKKIDQLKENMTNELGVDSKESIGQEEQIYLAVSDGKIVGCIFCERVRRGFRIITEINSPTFSCDKKNVEQGNFCGVSRIWVHRDFRRKGVGLRMLGTLAVHFDLLAGRVAPSRFAFTQPTQLGFLLFSHFTQMPNFLVYDQTCISSSSESNL